MMRKIRTQIQTSATIHATFTVTLVTGEVITGELTV